MSASLSSVQTEGLLFSTDLIITDGFGMGAVPPAPVVALLKGGHFGWPIPKKKRKRKENPFASNWMVPYIEAVQAIPLPKPEKPVELPEEEPRETPPKTIRRSSAQQKAAQALTVQVRAELARLNREAAREIQFRDEFRRMIEEEELLLLMGVFDE